MPRPKKQNHSHSADLDGSISSGLVDGSCGGQIPVPHTPEAVTLTKTLSPVSWSGLMVVLCLGTPLSWPLKTVKEGMLNVVISVVVSNDADIGRDSVVNLFDGGGKMGMRLCL